MIASVSPTFAPAWPAVGLALDGGVGVRLSAREGERCAALPTEEARRDFRAGRLAARRAVAALQRAGRDGVVPADGARMRSVAVSLAHRRGRGLAAAVGRPPAAAAGREPAVDGARARHGGLVGVDLEPEGAVGPAETRYFLSPRERRAFAGADPTVAWTLKEAVWKLLRLGRDVGFHAVEVVPGGAGGVPGLAGAGAGWAGRAGLRAAGLGPAGPLHVRFDGGVVEALYGVVRPWPGWIGTVVWTAEAAS